MRRPSGRRTARPDITGSSATRGWPLMSAFGGLPGFSSDLPLLLLGPPEVEKLQVARVPMMGPADRCRQGEHQAAKLLPGCFGRSHRRAQLEVDGVAERFVRTLEKNLLWVRSFARVAEVVEAQREFKPIYRER